MFENPYLIQQLAEAHIRDAHARAAQYRLARRARGAREGRVRLVAFLSAVLHFIVQL